MSHPYENIFMLTKYYCVKWREVKIESFRGLIKMSCN